MLQVKGKVNAVTVDACHGTGVVFDEVIASVEVVNCRSLQLQCTHAVPMIAIDKTDGCQVSVTARWTSLSGDKTIWAGFRTGNAGTQQIDSFTIACMLLFRMQRMPVLSLHSPSWFCQYFVL